MRQRLSLQKSFFLSAEEEHRLATMKLILQNDLQEMQRLRVSLADGATSSVVTAFPDVYGDLRMLRFLRKDEQQNPVSAAARYAQFLQWRRNKDIDALVRVSVQEKPFQTPFPIVQEHLPCEFDVHRSISTQMDTTKQTTMIPVILFVSDWDTAKMTDLIRSKKGTIRDHSS